MHVLRKHSTLALCFQPVGKQVHVAVGFCCSIGTEELPSLRHRLDLFAFVTIVTIALSAAVRLGLETRLFAFAVALGVVFPTSLLFRSYLANYSRWVAEQCGTHTILMEEAALLALALVLTAWLALHSSNADASATLSIALQTWMTTQLLEAAFLFAMHCACGCCGCCLYLGLKVRQGEEHAPATAPESADGAERGAAKEQSSTSGAPRPPAALEMQ
jgi:hypothetical protein